MRWLVIRPTLQGFSLALALSHSPKIVSDIREFAVQFGQFVRDDFRKCMVMHSDAIVFLFYKTTLIGQISVSARLVHLILPIKYLFNKDNQL